jgi:8-oxo-dGTP pyrophosphatase MutT (NUDIX family)
MKIIEIFGENRYPEYEKIREGCRGIIVRNGKILLSYEKNVDQYMIPGGGLEEGESLTECCVRELKEEVGVIALPHTHYLRLDEYYKEVYFKSNYFICDCIGECERALTEEENKRGLEPRLVDFNEALRIFGSYESYVNNDPTRYGSYYREFLALTEFNRWK